MTDSPVRPVRPVDEALPPSQSPRRPAVLLRLHAALAEERAGVADTLEQRAAELLHQHEAPKDDDEAPS